jgi:hypothetical protein
MYVMGGLVGVSVPLEGVGEFGTTGEDGLAAALARVFFVCAIFVCDPFAPKASIASEKPAVHNRVATKLRVLIKPDLEDEFFFVAG